MVSWRDKARLRPRELAEVASVSLATVKRKIASGEIESYMQDGCRFIPISAVLAFVGEPCETPSQTRTRPISPSALAFVARFRREAG